MEFEKGEFEQFWASFGHKQQRKRAERAFAAARAKVPLETIMAGVKRYRETRPSWQEPALASSWLSGERWNDEAPPQPNGDGHQARRTPEQRWADYWPERLTALKAAGLTNEEIEQDKAKRMKSIGVSHG